MNARGSRHHRGYVLVVTLALLVLAATLMVGVGRASLRRTLAARQAADDLQQRWGVVSCRAAVLPMAENLLVAAEQKVRKPMPVMRASVQLGEQRFDLIISDEQAKANVNVLIEESDAPRATSRILAALSGTGIANQLRIRPDARLRLPGVTTSPSKTTQPATTASTTPSTAPAAPQFVTAYGQVFDALAPQKLIGSLAGQLAAADMITCWGNGQINLHRVSERALTLAASPRMTAIEIRRIIEARSSATTQTAVAPPPGIRAAQTSSCHSIWIISRTKQRDSYDFTVRDESDASHPNDQSFVW